MWNLEKWYRWLSLQRRNRDTDIENKYMDTKEKGEGGRNWETEMGIYTLDTKYKIDTRLPRWLNSKESAC